MLAVGWIGWVLKEHDFQYFVLEHYQLSKCYIYSECFEERSELELKMWESSLCYLIVTRHNYMVEKTVRHGEGSGLGPKEDGYSGQFE